MNFVPGSETMADSLFYVYLIWVSCQDTKERLVVRYSHLPGIVAVLWKLSVVSSGDLAWAELLFTGLVLLLLQYISCRVHLYGVADGIVFWVCGMFCTMEHLGTELTGDLFLQGMTMCFAIQAVAGILLLLVQLAGRNVHGRSLKEPVAYIPYISCAFFLTKGVL